MITAANAAPTSRAGRTGHRVVRLVALRRRGGVGTGPLTYSYSWERCDAGEALCDPIEDADDTTYTLTSDDAGELIRVIVTVDDATSSNSVVARAWQSVRIAGGAANVAGPAISGDAVEGSPLSASAGTWDGGEPLVFSYQWESCDLDGEECSDIDLATAPTFVPGADEAGTALRVTVTATGSGGETSARSALTDEVTQLSPWNTDLPTATGDRRAAAGARAHGRARHLGRRRTDHLRLPVANVRPGRRVRGHLWRRRASSHAHGG